MPIFIRALCHSPQYGLEHLVRNPLTNQAPIPESQNHPTPETTKKEDIDNVLFPTIAPKKTLKCNLCQQKIPESWEPSGNWSLWYKKMSKVISQQRQEPLKKKYKVLAPPSSESSDQSDIENNREPHQVGRSAKQIKKQQTFLTDFSDHSMHSNSSE